jgi:outer membrane lipoprotein LolB
MAITFIAGCANYKRARDQKDSPIMRWRGRLSLRVEGSSGAGETPNQSFTAGFELSGGAEEGDLLFYTPLGSTAAAIHWDPTKAVLQASGETQEFSSLNLLISKLLGTGLPVTALFAWLDGQAQDSDGWQVDLSQKSQGKILAYRLTPAPHAELRVVLED